MAVLELYLVRHAIAADRGSDYPDDSKRPLTNAGISRFRKEAKALATLEVGIELVISSPLTRAKQTAEILAQAVTSRPSVTTTATFEAGWCAQTATPRLTSVGIRQRKPSTSRSYGASSTRERGRRGCG